MFNLSVPDQQSPVSLKKLEQFGFKVSPGGAHSSRTMMLDEVTQLLSTVPASAPDDQYIREILEANILGKKTVATREKTMRYLRELYGLSRSIPVFQIYRELCDFDRQALPLLSIMVAVARDPQLRATADTVIGTRVGNELTGTVVQTALQDAFQERYSDNNIGKISRNAASSWTQSGHLTGRTGKIRALVQPQPAAMTMAIILGVVGGWQGEQLLSTPWCRLLDLNRDQARSLALAAHREGLLTLRTIDTVFEVTFPRFARYLEFTA